MQSVACACVFSGTTGIRCLMNHFILGDLERRVGDPGVYCCDLTFEVRLFVTASQPILTMVFIPFQAALASSIYARNGLYPISEYYLVTNQSRFSHSAMAKT